jgi:tetratricopeptide (TPR) repeat protein
MEYTLDQTLQKGVEAHKAGKAQEADRYYTAILKANPKHPDANHNMGVLAVEINKVQEALLFFKTALEANATVAQFWLSYIDALIKLNQIDDAQTIIKKANKSIGNGNWTGLQTKKLRQYEIGIANVLSASSSEQRSQNPSEEQINCLVNLYTRGQYQETLNVASDLLLEFPKSFILYNIIGAANNSIGFFKKAIEAFQKAILIKPDFAEAYNNIGNALQTEDKLDEAVEAFNKAILIRPDFAEAYNNIGNALKEQGKLDDALEAFKKALSLSPNFAEAHSNMGKVLEAINKLDEAIEAFNKALKIKPDYSEAFNGMGNVFQRQDKLEEAAETYKKSISIKPNYADAYFNMGIVLKKQGKLIEALESYNEAVAIKPGYAEAHFNIGIIFNKQGKLEDALHAYRKALGIKPHYTEALNNTGNALLNQGKVEEAKEVYKQAIASKPDNAETYWNLSGTAENINEAVKWLKKCQEADPLYQNAGFSLSALRFLQGDETQFKALLKTDAKAHEHMRSFSWAFNLPKFPRLYFHKWELFDHMVELSKKNRPFYEFGVWRGETFKYLVNAFQKGYGFDTFQGLPEDWHNEKAGSYSSDGDIPKIKGGKFIVGKFEDTLPHFFAEKRPIASIINFDADLYSSTICALNYAKPVIDKHTILIFDEFLMNENWEQDEYKALEEFCSKNQYSYKVLAISFFTKQVAVKIIGI